MVFEGSVKKLNCNNRYGGRQLVSIDNSNLGLVFLTLVYNLRTLATAPLLQLQTSIITNFN